MRNIVIGLAFGLIAVGSGCGGGGAVAADQSTTGAPAQQTQASDDSSYTLQNNSNYDIHYVYISPTSQSTWGPDQLGPSQILHSGQSLTLTGVGCDSYDLKLVDEDGDECIQQGVQICNNTTLFIENDDLLHCEGYR